MTRRGEAGYARLAHDHYRTPAWVTEHLLEHIELDGSIWEPAAGDGDMVDVLAVDRDPELIHATDLRGFRGDPPVDFLCQEDYRFVNIVTNPPYSAAQQFIEKALEFADPQMGKVCMLLGHDYDTALKTRGHLFQHPAFWGKLMLPKRISWVGLEGKASPRQIHCWLIWDFFKLPSDQPVIIYP